MKAIVKDGLFVPQEPLPSDWTEGTKVEVEKTPESPANGQVHPTDAWMDEVERIASKGNPEDDERLEAAIQAIRLEAKQRPPKDLRLEP